MIAKGNPHNDGPYLARYLAAVSHGNEKAELSELRGFAANNVFDAFALGQLMAGGTRCDKPFFHVQVRTPKGENLTREHWQRVAESIERKLGFIDQPRAVVFHQKDGHEHMHLVWLRIDIDTRRALDPGLYKKKLKEVCRTLEKEMGLIQVRNERAPGEKTQPALRDEFEQSRRLKTDLKAIREDIRACWEMSDNGKSFAAALEERNLVLAQGDRRAFVIVDERGGYHALSKRITGATAKDTLSRLADIDPASLPSVEQAKSIQSERKRRQEEETEAMPGQKAKDEEQQKREAILREEEEKQAAIAKDEEEKRQAIREEDERKKEAIGKEEEAKHEAIKEAAHKDEEQRRAQFKEQLDRQVEQAREMEWQQARVDAHKAEIARMAEMEHLQARLDSYKAEIARQAEQAKQDEARQRQAQEEARVQEGAIRNSGSRYGQALAQHYDIKDPYSSLARSAMAEHGMFLRDREALNRQIAQAKDPTNRQALELRKDIEAAEYMAITSRRIASQSAVVSGKLNPKTRKLESEESIKQTARAEAFEKEAKELREQFRQLQMTRFMEKSEKSRPAPKAERHQEPNQKAAKPEARRQTEAEKKPEAPGIMVEERLRGQPRGKPQRLGEFVETIPMAAKPQQIAVTASDIKNYPALRRAHYAELVAEQNRGEALDRIQEDMQAGRNLSASDVRSLSREDLDKIKANGDNALKQVVQEHERFREQERERE